MIISVNGEVVRTIEVLQPVGEANDGYLRFCPEIKINIEEIRKKIGEYRKENVGRIPDIQIKLNIGQDFGADIKGLLLEE